MNESSTSSWGNSKRGIVKGKRTDDSPYPRSTETSSHKWLQTAQRPGRMDHEGGALSREEKHTSSWAEVGTMQTSSREDAAAERGWEASTVSEQVKLCQRANQRWLAPVSQPQASWPSQRARGLGHSLQRQGVDPRARTGPVRITHNTPGTQPSPPRAGCCGLQGKTRGLAA